VQVKALTKLELAVCSAPGGTYPTRLIAPQDIGGEARGKGHNQRYVHNILPEDKPADSLLVVEVWTNEGCTSSYPSHKHDTITRRTKPYSRRRLPSPQPGAGFVCNGFTDDQSLG
jgi:5-deoxy-glucuronate isomerase